MMTIVEVGQRARVKTSPNSKNYTNTGSIATIHRPGLTSIVEYTGGIMVTYHFMITKTKWGFASR